MIDILRSDAMRDRFKQGMKFTAEIAAVTLGPCARPVVVGDPHAPLRIAQTGLAVAKSMHFEDGAEMAGAALLRQVADWAQASAGDGTASAIAVAHVILREGVNLVGFGADPRQLRQGVDAALVEADRHLRHLARPLEGESALRQVATCAAADEELAALVAHAVDRAGPANLVVVEQARGDDMGLGSSACVRIAAGCQSLPALNSGGLRRDWHRLDHALVLVVRGPLPREDMFDAVLEHANRNHRPLVVAADQLLAGIRISLLHRARALGVRTLTIQVPHDMPGEPAKLERLALLVGASLYHGDNEDLPSHLHLGEASTVLADSCQTLVASAEHLGGSERHGAGFDRIAILRVPARDGELGDIRVRAERAAQAIHGASLHGVVPGGGVALLSCAEALAAVSRGMPDGEARLGFSVVQRALEEPFRQLVQNAGITPVSARRRLHRRDDIDFAGLSLPSGEVVNVVAAGILDPLPVPQGVLHAAASASRLLLTTEAVAAHSRHLATREVELRYAM